MTDKKPTKQRFPASPLSRKATVGISLALIITFLIIYFFFPEVWFNFRTAPYQDTPFVDTP